MIIEPKTIVLKDGRKAVLRSAEREDAPALAELSRQRLRETDFFLRVESESDTPLLLERRISFYMVDPRSAMILCEVEGALAGHCEIAAKRWIKTAHRADIFIGLLQAYWGQGIGRAMFEALTQFARRVGLEQLELEVHEDNARAIALYEKMWFEIAAVHPNFVHQPDGRSISEYLMIKKLI
ncbi:MAG: GNAT family N-acetyltransferase [Clostridia bacterium]|nr:GNAT family N-acetyltransferase [Clostridia bacterium]